MPRSLAALCAAAATTLVALVPAAAIASAHTITVRGKVATAPGGYFLTIQRPGHATGRIAAMDAAATRVTREDTPYVWGGGHGEAGIASVGEKGPGYNGKTRGFDCSGSVAAVLVAGGLWPQGGGVPNDAGVISYLRSRGLILKGGGTGPNEVTLYDDPGVHIFMNIDGRFFGTSDGSGGGDKKGGAGWLNDGAWDVGDKHFKRWHFRSSVLRTKTTAGLDLAFSLNGNWGLDAGLYKGDNVAVQYSTTKAGEMVAKTVALTGEKVSVGKVRWLAKTGKSFSLQLSHGGIRNFTVQTPSPVYGLAVGDQVYVKYTHKPGAHGGTTYDARLVTITSTPAPPTNPPSGDPAPSKK